MIDPKLPMELDDGTPVVVKSHNPSYIRVAFDKPPTRPGCEAGVRGWDQKGSCWVYATTTGIFSGGSAKNQFVLRNTATAFEPEEYEDWFV